MTARVDYERHGRTYALHRQADPRLGARYVILQTEALSVAAGLSVWIPLGSRSNFGSDGSLRALPRVLASGGGIGGYGGGLDAKRALLALEGVTLC